eukprot:1257648-Amphidinium_carterae.1
MDMEQLQQALQELHTRLGAAEARGAEAEARAQDLASRLAQTEITVNTMGQPAGSSRPLVDTRALGRPREFKSIRSEWQDWAFHFKAFLSGANAQAGQALDEAARADKEISMTDLGPARESLARQLYLALSLQVSGEALVKVQNVRDHNGLEAWRRLCDEYEPRTKGQQRHRLTKLLRPEKAASVDRTMYAIEAWEKEVAEYEKAFSKELDVDIKIGVLSYMAPDKVADHMHIYSEKISSYAEARR